MGRAGSKAGAVAPLVLVTTLLLGCSSDAGDEADGASAVDDSTVTSAGSRPTAEAIAVPTPGGIAATEDTIWVSSTDDDTVVPIDPATSELGDPIVVGDEPGQLAAEGSDLWVANAQDGSVSHVDTTTGEVASIEVGGVPSELAAGGGAVWVSNRDGLVRIDAATNEVVATVPEPVGFVSVAVAEDGTAWATDRTEDEQLLRVDPATNAVTARIPLDGAYGVAVLGDQVWVVDASGAELVPVDVATEEVGEPTRAYFTDPLRLLAIDDRLVVTSDSGGWATFEPPAEDPTEWLIEGGRTNGVAVLDGEVWMSDEADEVVYRSALEAS